MGQVFFTDINTDICDCSRIALDKYYIFTKKIEHGIEHDIDVAYGVGMN